MSNTSLRDDEDQPKEKKEKEDTASLTQRRSSIGPVSMPVITKPVLKFMPNYRLEPINPLNRERCEKIIKAVMNRAFENYTYTPRTALNYCCQVAEEVKNRLRAQYYDRYRYVVLVTVGEKLWQGYFTYINFLWDETRDGYVTNVYDDPRFFAIGTLFYMYYD